MVLTIYMLEASPPCRAVLMTAKSVGVELEKKTLNLLANEHKTPEYLKMNPQHTIPTFVDGDLILIDSHAVNAYLVGKYGKDDTLYPKDLAKRALVDQRLYFDAGTAFPLLKEIDLAILHGQKKVPQNKLEAIEEVYNILEKFLETEKWVAGPNVTIADFSLIATITSFLLYVKVTEQNYPKIFDWLQRASKLPWYSENVKGLQEFNTLLGDLMK